MKLARARALAVALLAVALVVTACGQSEPAAPVGAGDAAAMSDGEHHHDHDTMVEVDASVAPTIELEVIPDPMAGWNVHAITTNLTLAPEHAGLDHVPGEGHFHLYVDGEKVARVYTNWFHLAQLDPGVHEIEMTVNANNHAPYSVAGKKVAAAVTVDVPKPEDQGHSHSMKEPVEAGPDVAVSLRVEPDPVSGWNAFIDTEGFTWAPEHASTPHVPGEGHAHLYVDGVKLARVYGEAYHFALDTPGTHVVTVSLNTNDPAPYAHGGQPIEASVEIDVAGAPSAADHEVEIMVHDSQVMGPERLEVGVGDVVKLVVDAPEGDRVHVHGYDIYVATAPEAVEVVFTASIPGVFEVELEAAGLPLVELVVE